jgi:ribosomal protein L11 methyltransferase
LSAPEPDRWTTVRVRTSGDRAAAIAALFRLGAEAIQELDTEIVTHMRRPDRAAVAEALSAADAGAVAEFEPTPLRDWSVEWRSKITANRVGGMVVTPPWLADQFSEQERVIINPAMAFGTGEHETTRGALRLLQRVVKPGDTVADLGCGSAVLAIAAAKLGARRVSGIEADSDAIANAEENVESNGVADRVAIVEGDARLLLPLIAPVRVIVANIVSSVLLELLPVMSQSVDADGVAILSGILAHERTAVERDFSRQGWRVVDSSQEGTWVSLTLARV